MNIQNPIEFNSDREIVADSAGVHHRPTGTAITCATQLRLVFPNAEYRYKPDFEHQLAIGQAATEKNEPKLRALLGAAYVPIGRSEFEPGWTLVQHRPVVLAPNNYDELD